MIWTKTLNSVRSQDFSGNWLLWQNLWTPHMHDSLVFSYKFKECKPSDNPSNKWALSRKHASIQTRLSRVTSWDIIQLGRNQLGQFALLSLDSFTSSCMLMPLRGELSQGPMSNVKLWVPGRGAVDYDPFNNGSSIAGQQANDICRAKDWRSCR